MSLPFNITNPGISIVGLLTSTEQDYVTNLAGLTYVTGDILYYDGTDMINLGLGTVGQVLKSDGSIPEWGTSAGGGDMTAAVYDAAAITEQLVGLTATQTLTNKTIDGDTNTITNIGFAEFDTDVADTMSFIAGSYLDDPSVDITSNGTIITLSVEQSGGGDLRIHFLTGLYTWDTTPAATVALTAGSDTVPTMNYIYIDEATKTLTANTSGFPVADIVRVSEVLCPSATEVQAEGPYAQRNWTDHMSSTTCGHLAHINLWIRSQAATWLSGVTLTPTITVQGAGEDNVDVSTSSGSVLQLHSHAYPAFNTAVSSHMQIINHNATPYTEITDLNAADQDDAGNAIGNNDYTNLVIWGVVSEDANDCHLVVNLPSGFHSTSDGATIDAESYSNYTIPTDYKGTGFLIARLTLKYSTGTSGTWTLVENLDLRDGGVVGGSGTGSTEFSDNVFRILDDADTSKEIAFQASSIATATTRTLTAPDQDGTIMLQSKTVSDGDNEVGLTVTQNDITNNPTAVKVVNTGTGNSISVDQNGNTGGSNNTDASVHITNTDNTGIALGVYSNQGSSSASPLVIFEADAASFDQNVLRIQNDGTSNALELDNNGTGIGINVDHVGSSGTGIMIDRNGNGIAIHLDKDVTNANNTTTAQTIDHTSVVTDAGTYTKTGAALQINSNVTETSGTITDSAQVLDINQTHADATGNVVSVQNDGTGRGIFIDQNGNGVALNIDSEATSNRVISIASESTGSTIYLNQNSNGRSIEIDTEATTQGGILLLGDAIRTGTGSGSLLFVRQDHASSTGDAYHIQNDGTGRAMKIDQNGDGTSLVIDSEATTQPAINIDIVDGDAHIRLVGDSGNATPTEGDLWRESDGLKYYDGTTEHNLIDESTSVASSATPAPTGGSTRNKYYLTAPAANMTFSAPSGTAVNGNTLTVRLEGVATAYTLAWNAIYAGMADALPSTTVSNKTMRLGFEYNSTASKWELIALNTEA